MEKKDKIVKRGVISGYKYSVWDIGYESFSQCKNLQTIVIGNGVEEIDEGAFEDYEKLDMVVFGTGLKRIKKQAFHNCKVFRSVLWIAEINIRVCTKNSTDGFTM